MATYYHTALVSCLLIAISSLTLAFPNPTEGQVNNETDVRTEAAEESNLDFNVVRFHAESQKYYKIGSTEPCQENMRFFAVPKEAKIGQCDCDYYQCSRPLLYSNKTGNCYWAWSRGPCEGKEEWYTFTKDLKPVCEKNSCPESAAIHSMNFSFKNPEDGKCYEAGTQGYCKNDERLMIYPNEPIPKCRSSTICYALSIPAQQLCIQGNRRHHEGLCETEL